MQFLKSLNVYNVNSQKIRIGNPHDGGYILNDQLISHTKKLVSIGIGGEDSFEIDFAEKYPSIPIDMYDGTYPCSNICQKFNNRIHKDIFYYQYNVGNNDNEIKLFDIIHKSPQDTLLKIDIEGGEYTIFDNLLLEDNIIGLIIEIHDTHQSYNQDKIQKLINNNFKNLLLFHIHANSWGGTFDLIISDSNIPIKISHFPHVMELSFINKKVIDCYKLENQTFPQIGLDSSNRSDYPDIDLYWINQI